jgi:hypothetical protein
VAFSDSDSDSGSDGGGGCNSLMPSYLAGSIVAPEGFALAGDAFEGGGMLPAGSTVIDSPLVIDAGNGGRRGFFRSDGGSTGGGGTTDGSFRAGATREYGEESSEGASGSGSGSGSGSEFGGYSSPEEQHLRRDYDMADPPSPHSGRLSDRITILRARCVEGLGPGVFGEAYEFLKVHAWAGGSVALCCSLLLSLSVLLSLSLSLSLSRTHTHTHARAPSEWGR